MAKKREKMQVIRDILLVINEKNGKIKPTHIMYKSNLSYLMMEEYLNNLINKGFIIENKTNKTRTYSITIKGLNFLEQFKLINDFMGSFGLD
ncbi:MAG: DUF4364 family protein [Nanoarchaeota archaeon]|nr:DUF4364 family protein [Nanoarchaeota archaeon]